MVSTNLQQPFSSVWLKSFFTGLINCGHVVNVGMLTIARAPEPVHQINMDEVFNGISIDNTG